MTIEYLPNIGLILNSTQIKWGEDRQVVREKLDDSHKEDDHVIDMSEFFEGDESQILVQKRDIYEDLEFTKSSFFLSYDRNEKLSELEIHSGVKIHLYDLVLEFKSPIETMIHQLKKYSPEIDEIEKGNYLLAKLKMTIASDEAMGGEGMGLSYFYAAKDIKHLIE